jgi:Fe-S-cluster containining protein
VNVDLKAACPFQVDGLCSTHAIRPLGCRVYFCQAGTQDWQQDLYEKFQQQLVQLHKDHDIDYAYMEWRAGLAQAIPYCSK